VEERGLDSIFFNEHTHIPVSQLTPFPGGGELPNEYPHTHDPFVALAAAAAVTNRIMLSTGICLVIERDPIVLAKEVASLDRISGGRVILGVGAGWNVEEMENHGTSYKQRWKILRERVLAMREIWTRDVAQFHGEFVDFEPLWSWPKPDPKAWSEDPSWIEEPTMLLSASWVTATAGCQLAGPANRMIWLRAWGNCAPSASVSDGVSIRWNWRLAVCPRRRTWPSDFSGLGLNI
jgi:hypothetical protein